MELPEILHLLRRRWLVLLLTVEAALVVGFSLVLVATPEYRSTTTLFVANPVTDASGSDTLYADSRFSRERLASYAKLIAGPRVAEAVSSPPRRGPEVEYGESSAYWRERDLFLGRDLHGWVLGSSRDVEPFFPAVLDQALLARGCALVHAASVHAEGRGVLLAGWGGAGKTSALAELMAHRDARFLADDLSVVRSDGSLLAFPKSMYVYPCRASPWRPRAGAQACRDHVPAPPAPPRPPDEARPRR